MIKIGLLPLYIELYDNLHNKERPHIRQRHEKFCEDTARLLEGAGFEVMRSEICRLEPEFEAAVSSFESGGACCIVTLHPAYSPSLKSSGVLAKTKLPIIVLDITSTYNFSPAQNPDEISFNHGIHGVMDMCSLLRRNGKKFAIAAGHPEKSDVIDRVAGFIRAAYSAGSLAGSRTGLMGGSFDGMGDFLVSNEEMLSRFGVTVVTPEVSYMRGLAAAVTGAEIDAEIESDLAAFKPGDFTKETHALTTRDGLAVRKWLANENISGFSVNFLGAGKKIGLSTMPFMEINKAMSRGIGYAGEGDTLTSSFVGVLMRGFPDTAFVEIFCPDWEYGTLFLSHMGEMNIRLTADKPEMIEKSFIFGEAENPVACSGCYKSGEAVFVNICKTETDFGLLCAAVTMEAENTNNFAGRVRGWMRPKMPVGTFLEKLSLAGATHHGILVYGAKPEQIKFFGEILELETVLL